MLNKVTTVAENTICDYFRDICGWSLAEIMDLVENLHLNGKVGDKAFGLMSNLDRKFLEVVMESAAQVVEVDDNQYDDDRYYEQDNFDDYYYTNSEEEYHSA